MSVVDEMTGRSPEATPKNEFARLENIHLSTTFFYYNVVGPIFHDFCRVVYTFIHLVMSIEHVKLLSRLISYFYTMNYMLDLLR